MLTAFALVLLCASPAPAGQPEVVSAKVVPAEVAAGDHVRFEIEFNGRPMDIKQVIGYVREFPDMGPTVVLQPDKSGDKNVWVLESDVPYEAPMQSYHIDFTATDRAGREIVSKGMDEGAIGKTATIVLTVK
jgi:hypothetical protein